MDAIDRTHSRWGPHFFHSISLPCRDPNFRWEAGVSSSCTISLSLCQPNSTSQLDSSPPTRPLARISLSRVETVPLRRHAMTNEWSNSSSEAASAWHVDTNEAGFRDHRVPPSEEAFGDPELAAKIVLQRDHTIDGAASPAKPTPQNVSVSSHPRSRPGAYNLNVVGVRLVLPVANVTTM